MHNPCQTNTGLSPKEPQFVIRVKLHYQPKLGLFVSHWQTTFSFVRAWGCVNKIMESFQQHYNTDKAIQTSNVTPGVIHPPVMTYKYAVLTFQC